MANGYVVFDDAAGELNMSEGELKALMEEGKIRHFMDAGQVKFRRQDLDELKASLGIADEEQELTLAPPEDVGEAEVAEGEVLPPPPVEAGADEFGVAPLAEEEAAAAEEAPAEEEEIASLSEFEIGADVEDEGEDISGEEAELLSVGTPGFRTYEEPQGSSVGVTVLLVASIALVAFGAVTLFSFLMGHNPIPSLTNIFVK